MTQQNVKKEGQPNGNASSPGKDRTGCGTRTIIHPVETWHLARLAALREFKEELAPAITAKHSDPESVTELSRLLDWATAQIQASWLAYVEASCVHKYESDRLLDLGAPDIVELEDNEQVVKAMWYPQEVQRESWGIFEARAPDDRTNLPFLLTTPFREVRLASLPKGTQIIPIKDCRLAATAMLHEIIEMILRDIRTFSVGLEADQLWQRMVYQARFYRLAVKDAIKTLPADEYVVSKDETKTLSVDEYVKTDPILPEQVNLQDAPRIIEELCCTTRARHILALHIVARFYTDLIARCELKHADAGESDWVERVLVELTDAHHLVKETIAGYTAAVMAWARVSPEGKTVLTILSPYPKGVPALAIIPNDASPPPAALRDSP